MSHIVYGFFIFFPDAVYRHHEDSGFGSTMDTIKLFSLNI